MYPSGAHTIGRAHCSSVVDRVYPEQDPLMSDAMAAELRAACPDPLAGVAAMGRTIPTLNLDSTTPDHFDNTYYSNLEHNKGLLQSDQVRIALNNFSIYPDCMPYWNVCTLSISLDRYCKLINQPSSKYSYLLRVKVPDNSRTFQKALYLKIKYGLINSQPFFILTLLFIG